MCVYQLHQSLRENVEETFTKYVGIPLSDSEKESVDMDLLSTKNASAGEDSNNNGRRSGYWSDNRTPIFRGYWSGNWSRTSMSLSSLR